MSEINPTHYKTHSIETIEMMERIYGKEAVINFCELNAFKYRMRAGNKVNTPANSDIEKAKWYEDKIICLRK